MRKFLFLGLLAVAECVHSQPACPGITLRTSSSANLIPGASSRIRLVRQADGLYTGYEIADAAPHRILQTIPDFRTRVTPCAPLEDFRPWIPDASARLADGRFIVVSAGYPVHAALYDSSLNFISESDIPFDSPVQSVALADLDGDGAPDLVAGVTFNFGHNATIAVRRGLGGLSFQSPELRAAASLSIFARFTAGDIDGDGKLDLVATASVPTGGVRFFIFYGNGDGTLQPPVDFGPAWGASAVAIGDLNRDGVPDLVLTNGGGFSSTTVPIVSVALGKGNRAFADRTNYSTLGGEGVAVGDVDGDGNPDIVTSGVTILYGDGRGAFPRRRDYWNSNSGDVFLADFDRDGKTDLVIGRGNPQLLSGSRLSVFFNRGGGEFSGAPATPLDATDFAIVSAVSADFNRDGVPDLAISDLSRIRVLTGSAAGAFTMTFQAGVGGSHLATGDFNGDGITDLVAEVHDDTSRGGNILLFTGRGDGGFQPPVRFPIPDRSPVDIVAADFNGDGKLDVAVLIIRPEYPSTDEVLVYSGDGHGGFSTPAAYPTGQEARQIAAADFNRDGRADLAVACHGVDRVTNGEITLLFGDRTGGFSTSRLPLPDNVFSMSVTDVNGDGIPDLAVHGTSGFTALYLGSGDGTFLASSLLPEGYDDLAAADLNGDGVPELLDWGYPGVKIILGDGSATTLVHADGPWLLPDMNGDGLADLVSVSSSAIVAFLNASPVPPPLTVVSAASFAAGPLAPDSLVTVFGHDLTGAAVSVRDAAGVTRPAQILYAGAGQINFVVPAGTAPGDAVLTVGTATVPVTIATVAPSLFSATSITRDGGDSYVSFYGTGLRAARDVRVDIQGIPATVLYAGPQGQFPGLDQVNVLLPGELAGAGEVAAFLTADGVAANRVNLTIR